MKELIKLLPYNEVKFRFIRDHWDVHLNGTCMYNGNLCEFENTSPDYNEELDDWEEMFVKIYKLDFIDKIKWYYKQWLFEMCVGYHWTYPKRKDAYFYYRKPKWLYMWLSNCYYGKK
jgi:hypothetical protein